MCLLLDMVAVSIALEIRLGCLLYSGGAISKAHMNAQCEGLILPLTRRRCRISLLY